MNMHSLKQSFHQSYHEKFKNYFQIQETERNIELEFYKKTNAYIRFIQWIPWLKMIGIWNSVSMNCASKDSDIDLFIVTEPNRLWLVRVLITLIFSILKVRKTNTKHAWQLCLSFFSTTEWMNFWNFALKNDIYLYFWIIYLKPILNFDNTYEAFLEKNTSWAHFTQYQNILQNNKSYITYTKKTWTETSKLLTFVNSMLKKMLITKTMKTYKNLWKPYGIIINDHMLKFHNHDKRKKIRDELI